MHLDESSEHIRQLSGHLVHLPDSSFPKPASHFLHVATPVEQSLQLSGHRRHFPDNVPAVGPNPFSHWVQTLSFVHFAQKSGQLTHFDLIIVDPFDLNPYPVSQVLHSSIKSQSWQCSRHSPHIPVLTPLSFTNPYPFLH